MRGPFVETQVLVGLCWLAQWRKRLEIFVLEATVHGVAQNPIEIPHVI